MTRLEQNHPLDKFATLADNLPHYAFVPNDVLATHDFVVEAV